MNFKHRGNPLFDDLENIIEHTQDIWGSMHNARIFITGGTGSFGCWLLESFAWANDKFKLNAKVLVLTRNIESFVKKVPHLANNLSIDFYEGDVINFKFPDFKFTHIIHAATDTSGKLKKENPILMFDTIVKGTRRVLDFAVFCEAKKMLYISSGAIYGKQPFDITHLSEDFNGSPDVLNSSYTYGTGKRVAEHLCSLYSKKFNFEIKIARCFAFVGPYFPLDSHYAIGNFIGNGFNGDTINVKGDGTPYRSYLYASDLAIWLWTILINGKTCYPYNVGSDKDLTIATLADTVANIFKTPLKVKISKLSKKNDKAERYVPSIDRAKKELGLNVNINLEKAIKKTINWHKNFNNES